MSAERPTLAYQPALDGLRAIAVIMVLLFHGGVGWMRGGYVGVSVFFTLSGFLITSLLLREHAAAGRIDVGRFLGRRARRLLPASVVCLVGVALCSRVGLLDGVPHLTRDLLGSALQVQNWVLLASGESYTELLAVRGGRPSPLEHYWSLAIEEQFYWVWPVAFGVVAAGAGHRLVRRLALLAAVAALAAPLIAAWWGPDAAYWATPARLAEILIGAWLAAVVAHRGLHRDAAWMGPPALAVLVAAAVALPSDGGLAYEGGLPVIAVASCALVAALQIAGPLRRALAITPLVAVGRVSYGVYLYHWPVYVVLDEARTGLEGAVLLGVRLAVTAAIAAASFVLIEQPIRRATWNPRPTLALAAGAVAVVAVVAVLVPVTVDQDYWRADAATTPRVTPDAAPTRLEVVATTPTRPATVPSTAEVSTPLRPTAVPDPGDVDPVPSRPVRIVVVGDSTAEATGAGLATWATEHPERAEVVLVVSPGCGFLRGGVVASDGDVPFAANCDRLLDEVLPPTLDAFRPDVVMLMVTERDLLDREWDRAEGPIGPLDERFVERLRTDYAAISQRVIEHAALPVWVRAPDVDPFWLGPPEPFVDPARRAVVEEVIDSLSEPHDVGVVADLRAWTIADGIATVQSARPDGVHWTPDAAADVARRWLGPTLVDIAMEHA